MKMRSKIITFLTLIILPIIIGLAYNSITPFGLNIFHTNKKHFESSSILFNGINTTKVNSDIFSLISKDVWKLNDRHIIVFIDARDPWEYSKKRIANSINIPQFSFDINDPKLLALNKENLFVIYCSSEDCDLSFLLAKELKRAKFKNLAIMKDGIEGWKNNGLPMEGCEP